MLTANPNVTFGLFNGSMGTVIYNYSDGTSPRDSFHTVCMIEFPRYNGQPFCAKLKD